MKVFILAALAVACVYASDNKIKPCFPGSKTSVCDSDECCIGEGEFYKVGKRDVISKPSMPKLEKILFPWGNRAGRCVKYWTEGDNCYNQVRWRYCGCGKGLYCHYTPHPSEVKNKRAIPPQYRPKGVHACAKKD